MISKTKNCLNNSKETFHSYCQRLDDRLGIYSVYDQKLTEIVIADKNTPANFLALFAQSSEFSLLEILAANPSTPNEVLMGLAFHYEDSVRMWTAKNESCSDVLSETLAEDESINVRLAVASNHNSSIKALEILQKGKNLIIARVANITAKAFKAEEKRLSKV